MVANIEGLAGFTKRNRRSCEIFYARRKNTLGTTVLATCKYLHCNISKQRKRIEKLESFCDIFSPNSERYEYFQKIGNHIFKILTEA